MSDEQARELRRCTQALGQVITLCTLPKKAETALLQIHQRLSAIALPAPTQPEQVT